MAATTATRGSTGSATAPRAKRKAPFPIELYRSAVGKKYVMALTGIAIIGFVFFHMLGNLKMYFGPEDFDHYAEWLRELLVPFLPRTVTLWLLRIGLIVAFALHIHSAYSLTRMNHAARDMKYQSRRDYVAANYASRTMRYSGVIVGLFIVWHLFDLTFTGTGYTFVRGHVYDNVALSLGRGWNAAIYVVANIALGFHLFHGTWSLFQSMGWNNPRFNSYRRGFAAGLTAVIVLGNISFPLAVTAGIVSVPS
jgi:succinate dehydrogenase / fumarate reductase cytochrome b subunit